MDGQKKKKRCLYCGKKIDSRMKFCSAACMEKYEEAEKKDQPKIKYFVAGILLGFMIMFWGVCSMDHRLTGIGILLMGLLITLFPFTTPDTVLMLGYKRSKTAGRAAGIVTVLVGIWLMYRY